LELKKVLEIWEIGLNPVTMFRVGNKTNLKEQKRFRAER